MSHPLIASLGVACLLGALPLAAYATEDAALPAANPLLSSNIAQNGFKMLRVKTGAANSAARMTPVIYGPDFVPKWQTKAISHDSGPSKLEGDRFKFR
ncbi:hypothetical protein [Trinickia dinghuensis]|uniref:Uncharacterized protein n=1 Tax=Trinickia dinghuensis TaxID=2291023 RepID=A0A3D8JUJ1_9BURK|nr:hypothetical protein [Trinickia dinghuensis]RDU96306.1 hypothetical protein DWV00_24725 [Trinickia dinghuensis]